MMPQCAELRPCRAVISYGSLYHELAKPGAGVAPAGVTHAGFRIRYTMIGFATSELFFNGNPSVTLANLNGVDVTNMTISAGDRKLSYKFPLAFNYGTIETPFEQVLGGTGTITVKVTNDSSTANAIFVDYLVPYDRLKNQNQWFSYDPDVTPEEIVTGAPQETSEDDAQGDSKATKGDSVAVVVGAIVGSIAISVVGLVIAGQWYFKAKPARSSAAKSPVPIGKGPALSHA